MFKTKRVLATLIMSIALLANETYAQLPLTHNNNLRVDNDSHDCDYYVTPLAAYSISCSYQLISNLRTLITSETSYFFSRTALDNQAGSSMYYVGAMVEAPNGNVFVYCDSPTNNHLDITGNCLGLDLIIYYDYTAHYGPSLGEVDITD